MNNDMQYFAHIIGVPDSLQPINFVGSKAHLVIKRTRKRAIQRAAFMDKTGYEHSQWWHKTARKPKRWSK